MRGRGGGEARRRGGEEARRRGGEEARRGEWEEAGEVSRLKVSPLRLWLSILSGLLLLALAAPRLLAAPPAQAPDTPPAVSGGRALWTENCLPCHGPAGQGDGPTAQSIESELPDFADPQVARQLVPSENFEVIKNGRIEKLMPPWGNRLSEKQMWDLAAYVWSLGTPPQALSAGEALYTEQCATCHGENGQGDGPTAPAEIVDLTDWQVMVQRSQADLAANFRASEQHDKFSALSDEEVWSGLDYIRTFSFALPQRNGVLSGQVINTTTNQPQGKIEVKLHIFENETEVETLTTQADETGHYTFEQLPTDHATLYTVEGQYQDVAYFSDQPGVFTPDSVETELNLKVYETTSSAEAVHITQFHYLLSFAPDTVNVAQIFVIGNRGERTYIGQNGQTLAFALPTAAQNIMFQNDSGGSRFRPTDSGYVDTQPIPPGEESLSIVASYSLPATDNTLTIGVPIPADVASFNVLMQDRGANLSSEQMQFVETRQLQGEPFSIFNGANLKKGEVLTLKLTDLDQLELPATPNVPEATTPGGQFDQNLLRWIIAGLGGVVIILVTVVYPRFRPQLTHQAGIQYEDANLRRQKLLLMLARLDEVFEAGELDKQVYHRVRAKYKAELVGMMES